MKGYRVKEYRLPILAAMIFLVTGICLLLWRGSTGGDESPWTSSSHAALSQLEAGLEARAREDWQAAEEHFERALENDPDLLVARLQLAEIFPGRYGAEAREIFASADLARLSAREQFLLRSWAARREGDFAAARALRERFQEDAPDDLFGLLAECQEGWEGQDWDHAAPCYLRLAKRYPNWVEAHERLGYIALAQGRFSDSEEHFLTYRFIAPRRPSSHISLADLLIILGRWEEAETILLEALDITEASGEGNCKIRRQLYRVRILARRIDAAARTIEEVARDPSCAGMSQSGWVCGSRAHLRFVEGDLEGAWRIFDEGCLDRTDGFELLAHRLACMTGRDEQARHIEQRFADLREARSHLGSSSDWFESAGLHMSAVRSAALGDWAAAVKDFESADRILPYWSPHLASFKLYNRVNLVYSLRLEGDRKRADMLERKISAINPKLVSGMRLPDLEERLARRSED